MRWPFGPPHLTLKPSKKKTQKQKKKQRKQKKKQKTRKKRSQKKNSKNYPEISFLVISQIFLCFWVAFQNFLFLTPWPRKRAPKKHYKNKGFRAFFFEKLLCVTKRPFLDQKNPKFINFSHHFFWPISSLSTTKKPRIAETPIFIVF